MLRGWRQRGAKPWITRWMSLASGKSWMVGSDAWDASCSEMLAGDADTATPEGLFMGENQQNSGIC